MPDRMEHVDFLMVLQLNIVVKNSCQHAELSSLRHTLCLVCMFNTVIMLLCN